MKFANATRFYRKSGAAEGSAVPRTSPGNAFREEPKAVERLRFPLAAVTLCTIKQQETMEWDQGFVEGRCG
jgi:hypothetical protein